VALQIFAEYDYVINISQSNVKI